MIDEVKTCVNARVNYFEEYFSVPDQMKEDIDSFIQDMETLGNCCGSVAEFEQTFVSSGLSDRFYALIAVSYRITCNNGNQRTLRNP